MKDNPINARLRYTRLRILAWRDGRCTRCRKNKTAEASTKCERCLAQGRKDRKTVAVEVF